MPPRRGPDTRPPAGPSTRINDAIRVEKVRLIDDEGENRGEVRTDEALDIAARLNLDLVEVAPEARPPVCRIMDYGKWRYEQEQKAKQARKHQSTITVKEIKFRPKIDPHDYETKKGHVLRFLKHKDKVKVTIMFRGRELMHPERGEAILLQLAEEVQDLATIESRPNLDGRNMIMMLAPLKDTPPPKKEKSPPKDQGQPAAAEAPDDAENS
ncbi:MAG: translation initiation factor IF-3 [Miltoncostaeaceae bacterium]